MELGSVKILLENTIVLCPEKSMSLSEKRPNAELVLVRVLPYSDWSISEYLSIFSPNTGKYGPEKIPYLDTFDAVYLTSIIIRAKLFKIF